jgi:predicted CXXCH cytochrome family protein
VVQIKWDTTVASPDRHGLGEGGGAGAPYTDSTKNYIVGCLDCHEPHGSALPYMLREEVNGHAVNVASITSTDWKDFCAGCHASPHGSNCKNCHKHGSGQF